MKIFLEALIGLAQNMSVHLEAVKALLKVPSSGQIRSAWEWYHWIGLKKDINRYMLLIF